MPAIAIGAMALGGAVVGAVGASKAAKAQQYAADAATAEQRRQYNQTREDQMPWINAGQDAVRTLSGMVMPGGELSRDFTLADFTKDPGYDFRIAEGAKALERSAAARGSALGGGTLRQLTRYNQDFASNEFTNAYNRFQTNRATKYNQLAGLSNTGQTSANTIATVGMNAANNISRNELYKGEARASGYTGVANAINGGIGNILSAYMAKQQGLWGNKQAPQTSASYGYV